MSDFVPHDDYVELKLKLTHTEHNYAVLEEAARRMEADQTRTYTILGHTVALTIQLLSQHQNYDAGAVVQIIPVIFKALDEASR